MINSVVDLWVSYCEAKKHIEKLQEENEGLRAEMAEKQSQINLAKNYLDRYREVTGYSDMVHEDILSLIENGDNVK
jgi:predicted nuclease with TOPRIM domain